MYELDTPGVAGGDNASVRLDFDNEPQPDALLIIEPELGGQVRSSDADFIEGAPELIAEVVSSSVSYDLGKKLHVYRRHGVREYVVWRVLDRKIDWLVNREGQFDPMSPAPDGVLRSTVFPGLWLHPAALIEENYERLERALRDGLNSAEHAAFMAELRRRHRC